MLKSILMGGDKKLPIARITNTVYNQAVYEPSEDSFLLVDAFVQDRGVWEPRELCICAEVGSGSGYVITSAILALQKCHKAVHCFAIDVTEEAVRATASTLHAHGLHSVDVIRCDLLGPLRPALIGKVDLLFFNPPYVVTPDEEVSMDGISAAWAGGRDGRVVIDRLLDTVHEYLSPSGLMYMIAVHDNRPLDLIQNLACKTGLHGEVLLTRRADEELLYVLRFSRSIVT